MVNSLRAVPPRLLEQAALTWVVEAVGNVERLSGQQLRVLRLLGNGLDNAAIAKEIGRTERTVKMHVGMVMQRLAVESRLQAGIIGFAELISAAESGERRPRAAARKYS